MNRLRLYYRLMRMDKPIGALLLLWPTLWALWLASRGHPSPANVIVFVAGTFLMRSAGCVMNDLADRRLDPHVKRTAQRPLATGEVSTGEAVRLVLFLSVVAFALVCTRNGLTVLLSLPALFLAASYPLTKRFFPLPQAYLGIAFGFGIPMAFAAETGTVPLQGWVLLVANIFWTIAYDTEYAMVDRDDDIHLGVHSSALLFGRWDVAAVGLCYGAALGILWWVGFRSGLGLPYNLGLMAAAALSAYHLTLIRTRERMRCFKAFLHNNWWGAVVFLGLAADLARS
ncbi:MAG: 4-hydroxybenzoate octaprenyltransferase [Betaproteobacteria bacterium]|nr:4-hydroxybenzoate octaprenyltransferase [Betaproteobacteria bacterium]MDE2131275.1 4-hydroxybenzoate octaprenyltransferase [Betaproteobacteria bacterium]MDE2211332.1 4-hydroxybenzoate octaprenyltransferase [Betaproteobacteria bacterium]